MRTLDQPGAGCQVEPSRPDSTLDPSSRRLLLSTYFKLFIRRLRYGHEVEGAELLDLLPLTVHGEGQPSAETEPAGGVR
jgi:hypothetical protein